MRFVKKLFLWVGGVLAGLVLLLVLLGFLFEDKIHLFAIRKLEEALNARIEVRDTEVNFLSGFPHVRVSLHDLVINSKSDREGPDFIRVEEATFWVNLFSFFSDQYEIVGVRLSGPEVALHLGEDGVWNFDGILDGKEEAEPEPDDDKGLAFELSNFYLSDGGLKYSNQPGGTLLELDSIDLQLSGDFKQNRTELKARLDAWMERIQTGRVNWVQGKHVHTDLVLDAQFGDSAYYHIREALVQVASLKLDVKGELASRDKGMYFDLAYSSNENSFKSFLSLLPGHLLETGHDYRYGGDFRVHGAMKGLLGEGSVPVVNADFLVRNGNFKYDGYPGALTHVDMKGALRFKPADLTHSYLKIESVSANLNSHSLKGSFSYEDFNHPHLNAKLKGSLGLAEVRDFYPDLAMSQDLKGEISVDVLLDGKLSAFKLAQYNAVKASGTVKFQNAGFYNQAIEKRVEGLNGTVVMDNSRIHVSQLRGKVGHSDFELSGIASQYLDYVFDPNGNLVARLKVRSDRLDLNDWLGQEAEAVSESGSETTFVFSFPERINVLLDLNVKSFALAKLEASDLRGRCRLNGQHLSIQEVHMNALGGAMALSGQVELFPRQGASMALHTELTNVDVKRAFNTFDQLAAFALVKDNLTGTLSGNIHLSGEADQSLAILPEKLVSSGTFDFRNGRLKDFEPLEALAGFVKLEKLKDIHFSDLHTSFKIGNGFAEIPDLKVWANDYFLDLHGRHGLDNSLDYHLRIDLPRKEARKSSSNDVLAVIDETPKEKARLSIPVWISGTVDHPKFALDKAYVKSRIKAKVAQEGEELRQGFQEEVTAEFGVQDTTQVDDLIEEEAKDTLKRNPFKFIKKLKLPFKKRTSEME